MVAAGATVLMAASEENSSNESGSGTTRSINQSTGSRCSELQRCGQRNIESTVKGDVATCSLGIIEKKQRSLTTENNGKIVSKIELKESSKNFATCKNAPIRETKTSRLRAASIVLPNDVTLSSKKLLGSEISNSQRHNSSSKQKNSTSLDVSMNSVKERDKGYKRKSYLNRSRHVETAPDRSNEVECSERHSRRQYVKRSQIPETVSNPTDSSCRQMASLRRKHVDSRPGAQYITKNLSKTYSSSSVVPGTNTKRSIVQHPSGGIGDSEVSRRVDELTALTRATMERVERLASATTSCTNHSIDNVHIVPEKISMSPKKCITPRHTPVSILKHKTIDSEGSDRQVSSGSFHTPSPVTFSPSVTESVSHKRHGILKKRSSLDESEILRRRSCSPDVSFADNIYSEFRPILKNQRRSSLDEIVKRDQSPDQQPASILKRKSSREDDREIHRLSLGSPEPQSILKRKLASSVRANSVNHHVTIASDVASTNVSGNTSTSTNTSFISESLEGSEVKPILKKKYGKEELTGSDISSLEPRPILKKKSSTESDELEHDRPKKTILKSSRKNSYEEGSYETESTSPRKLSVLKNRGNEIENVRPILKQSSGSRYYDDTCDLTADSFLRKRAQSVGHARSTNYDDCIESIRVLAKRRSLESSSPIDVLHTSTTTRRCFTADRRSDEISCTANSSGVIKNKESKLPCQASSKKIKQVTNGMEEKNKIDSHVHFMKIDSNASATQTVDKKEAAEERQDDQSVYEDYTAVCRSNSVSKMTQHFKVLQEKANAAVAENSSQRVPQQKLSHGIQRYRERKIQSGERFNTQPVTFEEVREAVLQNQRNVATLMNATDNEPEPSKLSLVERVRLFNQKIAITETAAKNDTYQEKFIQRRRQSTRYRTQPVTSEEVQVASRMSPLNVNHKIETLVEGNSKECRRLLYSPPLAIASQHEVPKSILKSSAGYTQNLSRAKSPELRGMKLIKSVLKKEFEESEQPIILPSSEVYPRSILKSNFYSKPIQTTSVVDAAILRSERSLCTVENQNFNSETAKFCEKLDCFNVMTNLNMQDPCDEIRGETVSKQGDNMDNKEAAVPSHKTALFRNEEICLADRWKQQRGLPLPGLCRSATQVIASIETSETPSVSIADRLAALRHSGNTNWKRRVVGVRVDESCDNSSLNLEESTIKSGVLANCIEKLESAAESWKNRIVEPDAVNFTVAGKMKAPLKDVSSPFLTEATANVSNQKKKVPRPQWFKIRKDKEYNNDAVSIPTSPSKDLFSTKRTNFSESISSESDEESKTEHVLSPSVSVPKIDDETFTSFFSGVSLKKCETECLDLDESDFDSITPHSELLVQKRNIQMQRRRATSRNPLKVLAARTDLRSEYTEIRTNILYERTTKNFNMRKHSKSSSFAVEALAGLASTEDFSTVTLRNVSETSVSTNKLQPYKDIMLILVKGRRHVQVKLVEPVVGSINNGDSYILVTKSEVFNYIGKYSNIIEKTRAAEIALSIQQRKDLGCQAVEVITINDDKLTCSRNQVLKFWSYLGVVDIERLNIIEAGHPDEDELYESAIIDTNMVYELKDEQLVLYEKFWGTLPKIEMLNKNKILVFDFGTEMYIWSGKGISTDKKKLATHAITVHPDENDDMWLPNSSPVDFILEGCHLGRGIGCYDNELKKEYVVTTTSIMVWHIDEFSHTLLDGSSVGQFYSGDSYIIQWTYSVTITGRELSGLPSKHSAKGRDRSVYFIWQGRNASLNERGAAALLTIELDSNRGPQVHVVQGHEPAVFLNLFSGRMVVHSGKKSEKKSEKRWRLYICRGTLENETFLIEIPCSTRQLRSRSSFILLNTESAKLYIWHGSNSLPHIRENAIKAANKLKENRPAEVGLSNKNNIEMCEVQEGTEPEEFSNALGGINKKLYWSLETAEIQDHTPKLYHLTSVSKKFRATEILCPYRADLTTPFPFSQDDLYQANQPALFLLDDKNVIWIWQGWWPDSGTEDQSGSKTVRWQAERRAAMKIAIRYWQETRNAQTTNLPIYLIWAGLEPLQFTNLFPEWTYRDDVAELNIEDGRNSGEVLTAENELARLTQSTYPPAQLLQRPLPDGVDPTCLELYLSQQHFQELLGMSKEEFQQLPVWKQVNLKKDIGLF
ncbi:Supervillin [Cyphomyrmex costatus]|uniref:Supervillin n=1 Tax=Cyphomyrmex costatus TaxID=456900 RepID=A0A195CK51_9HYME|nr:Supervillin [Cyphomyrmex costatus]